MRTIRWEIYQDRKREFRFRLRARNGRIIVNAGEGYKRRAGALNAIEKVRNQAAFAPLVER